jgi:general stress protein 26
MEPVTELDDRFSDPDASATGWAEVQGAIESAEMFWISTVRADGRPHVTPLVAVWCEDALHFCTGAGEQKYVNLQANPQVILTTGSGRWEDGLDVIVEGVATRVTDADRLKRLAEAWRTKWDGRWHFEARDGAFHFEDDHGEAVVFEVRPVKVLSFAKGDFAATRHVFETG